MLSEKGDSFALQHTLKRKRAREDVKDQARFNRLQSFRKTQEEENINMVTNCSACGRDEGSNQSCEECLKKCGNDAFLRKDYAQALTLYTSAIDIGQGSAALYSNRSATHAYMNNWQAALEDADAALRINPSWAKAYLRRATSLAELGRHEESIRSYMHVIHLDIDNQSNLNALLDTVIRHVLTPKKTEICGKSPLLCGLCFNFFLEPLTLSCGHTFCKSCLVKRDSFKCPDCQHSFSKSNLPAVNICLNNFLRKFLPSQYSAILYKEQGNSAFAENDFERALQLYNQALEYAPDNHVILSNISAVEVKLEKNDEALEHINRSISLRPDWTKAYVRKSSILAGKGNYNEAIRVICDALKTDLQNAELFAFFKSYVQKYAEQKPDECQIDMFSGTDFPAKISIAMPQLEVTPTTTADMNCSLCFDLLCDPLTPKCGHTFCRMCLSRALDHHDACPMCRTPLPTSLNRQSGDVSLSAILTDIWPDEYKIRTDQINLELEDLKTNVPIFVCALLYPNTPMPLHIFEPRYRLMLRRCMESGTRRFGMVTHTSRGGFSNYGTMAQIGEVQMLPDGRSLIDTTGTQRFKILSHGVSDGYMVAKIEFIEDDPVTPEEAENIKRVTAELSVSTTAWVNSLSAENRARLLSYGAIPEDPYKLGWWLANIAPIGESQQLRLLQNTNLLSRLEKMKEVW